MQKKKKKYVSDIVPPAFLFLTLSFFNKQHKVSNTSMDSGWGPLILWIPKSLTLGNKHTNMTMIIFFHISVLLVWGNIECLDHDCQIRQVSGTDVLFILQGGSKDYLWPETGSIHPIELKHIMNPSTCIHFFARNFSKNTSFDRSGKETLDFF